MPNGYLCAFATHSHTHTKTGAHILLRHASFAQKARLLFRPTSYYPSVCFSPTPMLGSGYTLSMSSSSSTSSSLPWRTQFRSAHIFAHTRTRFTWLYVCVCVCLCWMSGNDGWFNYSCCLASTCRTAESAVLSANCNRYQLSGQLKSAHTHKQTHTSEQ